MLLGHGRIRPVYAVPDELSEEREADLACHLVMVLAFAVREEDKDAQWVKDLMDAMTSDAQVEVINSKNEPDLAWKILFR